MAVESENLDAEMVAEQSAVDQAYQRLDALRADAIGVIESHQGLAEVGSAQSRSEWESLLAMTQQRLGQLEIGAAPLCFGRIDTDRGDSLLVGRFGIMDNEGDALVLDWRAPAAEAFYRATGRHPLGLVRRRHLHTRGSQVIGVEDELFDPDLAERAELAVVGEGALMAALERGRTGRMGDIVATIQSEQDRIIRAPLPGALVVQGGPGTGKTAVALHRAAYLLFTNRERLEESGVLVVGPNPRFLRYIEQVLPSLGESGVTMTTTATLSARRSGPVTEPDAVRRIKGDIRMVDLLRRAVRRRGRSLREPLEIPYGSRVLRIDESILRDLARDVGRMTGTHNAKRAVFVSMLQQVLWSRWRAIVEARLSADPDQAALHEDTEIELVDRPVDTIIERERERFFGVIGDVRELWIALERMWPILTAEELLHDLFGGRALLAAAGRGIVSDDELQLLHRKRSATVNEVDWSAADLALLDEAETLLGPVPKRQSQSTALDEDTRWTIEDVVEQVVGDLAYQFDSFQTDEDSVSRAILDRNMRAQIVTRIARSERAGRREDAQVLDRVYGHVIVDEAQDISAMEWRMIARRCPSGSFTIVGDLGQASASAGATSWERVVDHLPGHREPRVTELEVNYRTPAEIMAVAAEILARAAPGQTPPRSVRSTGIGPRFRRIATCDRAHAVLAEVDWLREELQTPKIAVIAAEGSVEALAPDLFARESLSPTASGHDPLDQAVTVMTPAESKGLEFDAVIVVEPSRIVGHHDESERGLRELYVAVTRATQRLSVIHSTPLPPYLACVGQSTHS